MYIMILIVILPNGFVEEQQLNYEHLEKKKL